MPSQTELLFDLGLDNEILGITKFCIHPADKIKNKEKIGGTKKFNIEKILALRPDLIIGNKEENYPEGIQQLRQHYLVWMSDIVTLADACSMIKEIGRITDRSNEGGMMGDEILKRFNSLQPLRKQYRAAYFIWRHPYMVAAGNTFIHEMLMKLGVENVYDHLSRYPEIKLNMLAEQKPDLIFLSSEPYPFSEKHFAEFASAIPQAKIMIVDGQYFSWYGSRLLQVPGYFDWLKRQF